MLMSLEIRRNSCEKPRYADESLKSGETAMRSLDMLMSREIRRNSCEKPGAFNKFFSVAKKMHSLCSDLAETSTE